MGRFEDFLKKPRGFEAEEFVNPDSFFGPAYSWVWNAPASDEISKKQIDDMLEAGIRSFYILPEPPGFRPKTMVTKLDPPYLSDEYMERVRFAVGYAAKNGMTVWLYDEGGWPSGSACGLVVAQNPEYAIKGMKKENGENKVRALSGFRADLLNPAAVETFIRLTHEKYKEYLKPYFGEVIPFMFDDEAYIAPNAWPEGIEERFYREYGYRLEEFIPVLFSNKEELSPREQKARGDFGMLRGKMFEERFWERIREWCNANGLFSVGHLDHDHLTVGSEDMGYGSALSVLRRLDVPGIDVICWQIGRPDGREACEGNRFFPRFAASAAAQNGGLLALSESFAVYGAGLSFDDMRYIVNYQYARGINLLNVMAISYGREGFLSLNFRPSFAPELMPAYDNLKAFNEYAARLSYALSLGRPCACAALYLPARDLWTGGSVAKNAQTSFESLGRELEDRGIDFDIIDDEAILSGRFEKGELCVGLARYAKIYIPDCIYMPQKVREIAGQVDACVQPYASAGCGFEKLKIKKRLLPDGEIYFLYNEGLERLDCRAELKCGKYAHAYRLSPEDGAIYPADNSGRVELSLECGEAALYLFTDRVYSLSPTRRRDLRDWKTIENFSLSVERVFEVGAFGASARKDNRRFENVGPGSWESLLGKGFSGEAVYRAEFELGRGGEAELSLGKVEYSAGVRVNGVDLGPVIFKPMKVYLPEGVLKAGKNLLEITVSNTLANALAVSELERYFTPAELGNYHERSLFYEAKSLGGGLYGPVKLRLKA